MVKKHIWNVVDVCMICGARLFDIDVTCPGHSDETPYYILAKEGKLPVKHKE